MNLYAYRCPYCPTTVSLATVDAAPVCTGNHPPVPMQRMGENARALLPIDPPPSHIVTPGMVPLKVEHLKAAGILLPETQHALEWLYRHRERNGMAEAFMRVGGRRCIDLVAFARLMRARRA